MASKKKKTVIIILAVLAAVVALTLVWIFYLRDLILDPGFVDVERVSVITKLDGGITERYAGIVEPQDTFELRVDPSRRLAYTYVSPGDEIAQGTALIEYETTELELELEQKKLDVLRVENTISSYNTQISNLNKQKTSATAALQLEYTQQIQSYEASVKQEEYNKRVLELEIDSLRDLIDASVIVSPFDGVVLSVDEALALGGGPDTAPYMVVNALGGYRVRGEVSELQAANLEPGARVVVRSRLDPDIIWDGEIAEIDLYSPLSRGGAPVTLQTSRYPFYVTVINYENLMLGQHVYIEPDVPEMTRSGIWLLLYYLQTDDRGPFVWAVNRETDKLERRYVSLGGYDAERKLYEVKEGLAPDDELAWPSPELKSGMKPRRGSFDAPERQDMRPPSPSPSPQEPSETGETDGGDATVPPSPDASDGNTLAPPPVSSDGPTSGSNINPPTQRPSTDSNITPPPAGINDEEGDVVSIPD